MMAVLRTDHGVKRVVCVESESESGSVRLLRAPEDAEFELLLGSACLCVCVCVCVCVVCVCMYVYVCVCVCTYNIFTL